MQILRQRIPDCWTGRGEGTRTKRDVGIYLYLLESQKEFELLHEMKCLPRLHEIAYDNDLRVHANRCNQLSLRSFAVFPEPCPLSLPAEHSDISC